MVAYLPSIEQLDLNMRTGYGTAVMDQTVMSQVSFTVWLSKTLVNFSAYWATFFKMLNLIILLYYPKQNKKTTHIKMLLT